MKQQGYTLIEIMVAVGVVAALVIGGLNYYHHAIAKAQGSQGFTAQKIVIDDVFTYYAHRDSLPQSNANYGGRFANDLRYVDVSEWVLDGTDPQKGMVVVTYKNTGLQQVLSGKNLCFHYEVEGSGQGSHISYQNCTTNVEAGLLDSTALTVGAGSSIFQECTYDSACLSPSLALLNQEVGAATQAMSQASALMDTVNAAVTNMNALAQTAAQQAAAAAADAQLALSAANSALNALNAATTTATADLATAAAASVSAAAAAVQAAADAAIAASNATQALIDSQIAGTQTAIDAATSAAGYETAAAVAATNASTAATLAEIASQDAQTLAQSLDASLIVSSQAESQAATTASTNAAADLASLNQLVTDVSNASIAAQTYHDLVEQAANDALNTSDLSVATIARQQAEANLALLQAQLDVINALVPSIQADASDITTEATNAAAARVAAEIDAVDEIAVIDGILAQIEAAKNSAVNEKNNAETARDAAESAKDDAIIQALIAAQEAANAGPNYQTNINGSGCTYNTDIKRYYDDGNGVSCAVYSMGCSGWSSWEDSGQRCNYTTINGVHCVWNHATHSGYVDGNGDCTFTCDNNSTCWNENPPNDPN
jgi:prepilin-type N-terminal cleavage/methylation domain-containing protein